MRNNQNKNEFIKKICEDTWKELYRFIYYKVQNREEAQDITQETYTRAISYLSGNDSRVQNYSNYLKTISMNIIRDQWRVKKRQGIHINLEEIDPEEIASKDFSEAVDNRELIAAAIKQLTKDQPSNAILGTVNSNKAEIITAETAPSIRWQEQGMEYQVSGNVSVEDLAAFAEGISEGKVVIPQSETEVTDKPQIEVPVDLAAEENEQKSVDTGHSPWKLDPTFVTQVFASLLLSPEGIVGDYPIPYEDITIIENNGIEAKAEIKTDKTLAKYVYLKRLVRQDDTGIWTVVGYDPAK